MTPVLTFKIELLQCSTTCSTAQQNKQDNNTRNHNLVFCISRLHMSGVTLRHTNITTSVQKKIYKTLLTILWSLSYSVQLLTSWEWDPVVVHTTVLTAPIDAFKSEYWIPMSSKAVLCHCQDYVFLFCYYNLIYRWSALWLGSVSIILILLGLLHLLKTNWYIIVIFCGNLKSSHHGTLAKTTKYFWIFYSPILRGKTACNQNQMTKPGTLC